MTNTFHKLYHKITSNRNIRRYNGYDTSGHLTGKRVGIRKFCVDGRQKDGAARQRNEEKHGAGAMTGQT